MKHKITLTLLMLGSTTVLFALQSNPDVTDARHLAGVRASTLPAQYQVNAISKTAPKKPLTSLNSEGITLNSPDGNYQANLTGLLMYDNYAFSHNPMNVKGNGDFRRIETSQTFTFYQDWSLNFQQRWVQKLKETDAFIQYTGKHFQMYVGQASPSFGLNNTSELEGLPFLEFAMPAIALSPGYYMSASPTIFNQQWSFNFSVNGKRLASKYKGHSPLGITSRLIYSPFHDDDGNVLDMGFSTWYQKPAGDNNASFGSIPEVHTASRARFVDTGDISNVNHFVVGDVELAYERGPLFLAAEYYRTQVDRNTREPNLQFSGYYGSVGYFLTGEHRQYFYPDGYFMGPASINHAYGAISVNGRLSQVDLNSHDIRGGEELNGTLGINWYITSVVALKLNYIHVWNHLATTSQRSQFNILALRLEMGIR